MDVPRVERASHPAPGSHERRERRGASAPEVTSRWRSRCQRHGHHDPVAVHRREGGQLDRAVGGRRRGPDLVPERSGLDVPAGVDGDQTDLVEGSPASSAAGVGSGTNPGQTQTCPPWTVRACAACLSIGEEGVGGSRPVAVGQLPVAADDRCPALLDDVADRGRRPTLGDRSPSYRCCASLRRVGDLRLLRHRVACRVHRRRPGPGTVRGGAHTEVPPGLRRPAVAQGAARRLGRAGASTHGDAGADEDAAARECLRPILEDAADDLRAGALGGRARLGDSCSRWIVDIAVAGVQHAGGGAGLADEPSCARPAGGD